MAVIATAGHVDHGKSTLVRLLTGQEPDRWAEERRRGLTIDLGYAWTDIDGVRVSLVDVPGHEHFTGNMLAGLGPVAAVMFVVAADDGWRPQSEEHARAIAALGIEHVLLAVTRCDLIPGDAAAREAAERLESLGVPVAEAVLVSGATGDGLPDLRMALGRLSASAAPVDTPPSRPASPHQSDLPDASRQPETPILPAPFARYAVPPVVGHGIARASAHPVGHGISRASAHPVGHGISSDLPDAMVRLWVDRSFTIRGAGTVVTGTLSAGRLVVGDELLLQGAPVRVRGLQTCGEDVGAVVGPARVAVNLRGIEVAHAPRGVALLDARWTEPLVTVVDVALRLMQATSAPELPVPQRLPRQLTLHVGTAAVPTRTEVLTDGLVRLRLAVALPSTPATEPCCETPVATRYWQGSTSAWWTPHAPARAP